MSALIRFIKRHWLLLVAILIGGFFRLYNLEPSLQFLGDQGRDVLIMKRILVDHDLTFIGPVTSVGDMYLGPFYYYAMAPFLWLFGYNPVGPAVATAVIGILTIPAIYFVASSLISKAAAPIAALLFALGSVPIVQTRGAWNPNPMPLVALGIIWSLYQIKQKQKYSALWLLALSLGIAFQLHYMIIFLAPFLLLQVLPLLKKPAARKPILISGLILLLLNLPIILFEIKNHFLNLKGLDYFLSTNNYEKFNLIQYLKNLNGRSEALIGMLLGFGETASAFRTWVTRFFLLALTWVWLKKPKKPVVMLIIYLLLSLLAINFYRGLIFPHYLGFVLPVIYLLSGAILVKIFPKIPILSYLVIGIFFSFNWPAIQATLKSRGNLHNVAKTSRFIAQDIAENGYTNYNLTLIDDTRDYKAMNFRYFLELDGNHPLGPADYPQTQVLYVVSPYPQVDVINNPIWEIKSLWPGRETEAWEFPDSENIYKIERDE